MGRPLIFAALALSMFGCAKKENNRGAVFCESYSRNYVLECRKVCEAELSADDEAGSCEKQCQSELQKDETYQDDCLDKD